MHIKRSSKPARLKRGVRCSVPPSRKGQNGLLIATDVGLEAWSSVKSSVGRSVCRGTGLNRSFFFCNDMCAVEHIQQVFASVLDCASIGEVDFCV